MSLDDRLNALIFERHPVRAALMGMGDSAELVDYREEAEEWYVQRLRAIATEHDDDPITQAIVRHSAQAEIESVESRLVEFDVSDNIRTAVPELLYLLPRIPVDTPERAAAHVRRLANVPAFLDTIAERHRTGIAHGRTPVAHLVVQAIESIDRYTATETIGPALEKYRQVLETEVLPHGRDAQHAGLCWVPGGDAIYRAAIRRHTTESIDPAELHTTGLNLIEQLKQEFTAVTGEPHQEVFRRIRTDPDLRYRTEQEVLDLARAAMQRAEAVAPQWFHTVPASRCAIEAIAASAPASVPNHYLPAAVDGSRPGTYFVNTKEPHEHLRIEAESTAFHEAVPGHHFELERSAGLPLLRRRASISAFTEGWALYCERLADEMGLYRDDLGKLGLLTKESIRAGRLVVDTGLHAKGWSRQHAVDYLREHTPMAEARIQAEVDRYLSEPAQALAYMVGRLKFDELRKRAAGRDVRDFHEVVLGQGRLTLALLDEVVTAWLES